MLGLLLTSLLASIVCLLAVAILVAGLAELLLA